jgi:AraC family transcriptional regulator of adaptative response / DNA-3-methyladenine glycosylase II
VTRSENGELWLGAFGKNGGMGLLDRASCYRALRARDRRFDGRFFVGVRTTGIYCRPICPARTPHLENVTFYPSAAAAQDAGFRPCLRCRPEASPDLALWRGTSNTVARALALIAGGALDGDDTGVDALAARVGVGERQLRRLFREHLGASPIAVAQTRRVLFAKQLVQETRMPMIQVALAAGFGSLRRFNATFQNLYGRSPSELRRRRRDGSEPSSVDAAHGVTLYVSYRPPYDWDAMLAHLAARAIPGVEKVDAGSYRRCVSENGLDGTIEVTNVPDRRALAVTIRFPEVRALPALVARVKRLFDVGADVDAIGRQLAADTTLAPLIARRPGLRVPGAWDGFELAVRAVLGQQVTVVAARKLAGKLVTVCGTPAANGDGEGLYRVFPDPRQLSVANLDALGMPGARKMTLKALADAATKNARLFEPAATLDDAVARLRSIPGIGDWTAQYISLRALRETDAFPAADAGLLRAASAVAALATPKALLARAETWRPWRAYAAQHLWAADADEKWTTKEAAYA